MSPFRVGPVSLMNIVGMSDDALSRTAGTLTANIPLASDQDLIRRSQAILAAIRDEIGERAARREASTQ
jgi:hypothetical protein